MKKFHQFLFIFITFLFISHSIYAGHYSTIKLNSVDLSQEKITLFSQYKKINAAYLLINYAFRITTPAFEELGIGAEFDVRDLYHHDKAVKLNLLVFTTSKIKEQIEIPVFHKGPTEEEKEVLNMTGVNAQKFCDETISKVFNKLATPEDGKYKVEFTLKCDKEGKMKGKVTICPRE